MKVNRKVRSGNRLVVEVDGAVVGFAQNVSANDDYAPEGASGIGDIHVQEYVPTQARHTFSMSKMVLDNERLRAAGVLHENGDAALKGFVWDMVKRDKETGEELRAYIGCSMASGSIDTSKHQIIMSSGQFNCLDVRGTGI